MATKLSRTRQRIEHQLMIEGLQKHQSVLSSVAIGGVSLTTADVVANLQTLIDSADTATSTRAAWRAAVQADRERIAKAKGFVSGLKQATRVAFAGSIDALADFGLVQRKMHVPTPEQTMAATAKALATRAARHTMGKRQREAIKGTVPAATPGEAGRTGASGETSGTAVPAVRE